MTPPVLRPLSVGEVLDVSFGLYRSKFATLLTIAVATQLVPSLVSVYLTSAGGWLTNIPLYLASMLLAVVLSALGVAASTFVVSDAYLGRETSAGVALSKAGGLLARLIGLSILTSLVIGIGVLLLIVPGLVLAAGLMLSTVVLVLESPPSVTAAMGRAWALSKGFRGKILLTMVVVFLMLVVPSVVIGAAWALIGRGTGAGPAESVPMVVLQSLLSILVYPFVYVVLTVLYYDIRVRKEGFDLELLASSVAGT